LLYDLPGVGVRISKINAPNRRKSANYR
jgi:hypothetical protein